LLVEAQTAARLYRITPTAAEAAALQALVKQGSPDEAKRARVIEMRAHGLTYDEVRRETELNVPVMLKWIRRFLVGSAAGLRDRRHGSRRRATCTKAR